MVQNPALTFLIGRYPRKVEKIEAKKLTRAIIEGRRRDGFKATPQELLAGVIRYAAVMTGKDPRVWSAIDAMPARNRRAG
jgi:hypothetical protein